jgi:hypothetical protein
MQEVPHKRKPKEGKKNGINPTTTQHETRRQIGQEQQQPLFPQQLDDPPLNPSFQRSKDLTNRVIRIIKSRN